MTQKKTTFPVLLLVTFIIILFFPTIIYSHEFLNEEVIQRNLKYVQESEYININQKAIINYLQSALFFVAEKKSSEIKIKKYQKIINTFSYKALQLREDYNNITNPPIQINQYISIQQLKTQSIQLSNQLTYLLEQLQYEQEQIRSIYESLKLLPQQLINIKNVLYKLERKQEKIPNNYSYASSLEYAKFTAYHAEQIAHRLKITELEFAQLSANNRQELSKLQIALLKKKYDYTYDQLIIIKNQLNKLHHKTIIQTITNTNQKINKKYNTLPQSIQHQLQNNYNFSLLLNQQINYTNHLILKKKEVETYILKIHQIFSDLIQQSLWINKSPNLEKKILRYQITKLPQTPKIQQLNNDITQLQLKRSQYENYINKLPTILNNSKQNNGKILTFYQQKILKEQLNVQRRIILLILNNYDNQILDLIKLKLSYNQLKNSLKDIKQATHRYLFWIADLHPITISYPLYIYQDSMNLFTNKTLYYQIKFILQIIYNNHNILALLIFCLLITLVIHFIMKKKYNTFLKKSKKIIGKVNQDSFLITFYNIWYSLILSLPMPILWLIIGYVLKNYVWQSSLAIAIGDSMHTTAIILWTFIISSYFASPMGLFIVHFGWSKKNIQQVFSKNYFWYTTIIIVLTTTLSVFRNYNNQEFSNTLGRLCFILLCIYLTIITNNLKRSKLPLYLHKNDSSDNIINKSLWNVMISAPIISIIACSFGYLSTSQELLGRLETSLFICIISLIIYHIIRRWMFIQRKRIAFERLKQKKTAQLKNLNIPSYISNVALIHQHEQSISDISENNKKILDLNTISSQSLQLIRSIITLIALLSMTILWSELRSAFSFLENITLWDVTSTIKGVENIQPITLNILLIFILIIIITTTTVRNLPSLLELTVLQHLNLTPGTGYAITTLTKYILMIIGGSIGLSLIGIEWVKIQWLIAALGVGLGFGLQEIFANFISGLIILFEKPIRIKDTITIHNFTGIVKKINTRATIITDRNNKEIIIPNKEFITKQFTNWSLSNAITRVILRVPASLQIDIKKMTYVLFQISKNSPLSLNTPAPEVYLIDLKQGLPIFELRIYTANIKSRTPLCHQINTSIIEFYKNNGLEFPLLPITLYK